MKTKIIKKKYKIQKHTIMQQLERGAADDKETLRKSKRRKVGEEGC